MSMSHEDLTSLTSPQRFRTESGPSWAEYADALKPLDGFWREKRFRNTSFGVLGPRLSWPDTINRAAPLFDMETWAELDAEQASMIAPTHFFEDGNALLGSVGRRSTDVRNFLDDPRAADDRDRVLSLLKRARGLSDRSIVLVGAGRSAQLCDVRGIGRSFATRLLTLRETRWLRSGQQQVSGLASCGERPCARRKRTKLSRATWMAPTANRGDDAPSRGTSPSERCGEFERRCLTPSPINLGSRRTILPFGTVEGGG